MNSTKQKPTNIYWLISVIALIWNCVGVAAYLTQAYMTDEALKMLTEKNQLYFSNMPAWVTSAFAVAVFGGFFGAVGLIVQKKWAHLLFVISLVALVVQHTYDFFIQKYIELTGPQLILPTFTFFIAVYLVYFSRLKVQQGILV